MRPLKKIGLFLVIILIIIQFFPAARNQGTGASASEITQVYAIPDSVLAVLKRSCYDCHSEHTHYPWYFRVQPVGWLLASHIREGKADLNFSEFGSYSPRRRFSKLKTIEGSIQDGSMPLFSYTLIHRKALLSEEEKQTLIYWLEKTRDSLSKK